MDLHQIEPQAPLLVVPLSQKRLKLTQIIFFSAHWPFPSVRHHSPLSPNVTAAKSCGFNSRKWLDTPFLVQFGFIRPTFGPTLRLNIFSQHFEHYHQLQIVALYMQLQQNPMIYNRENGRKPHLAPYCPNLGPTFFSRKPGFVTFLQSIDPNFMKKS